MHGIRLLNFVDLGRKNRYSLQVCANNEHVYSFVIQTIAFALWFGNSILFIKRYVPQKWNKK